MAKKDYLLTSVADIAFNAATLGFFSGNSREDNANFIWWAKEFEKEHKDTDWETTDLDYVIEIDRFSAKKMLEYKKANGLEQLNLKRKFDERAAKRMAKQ